MALILRAATRYCSSSDGETFKTSAMLSKPLLSSSGGSSSLTSTSRFEQIANGVAVFRAIQAVKRGPARAPDAPRKPCPGRFRAATPSQSIGSLIRLGPAQRRHHSGPELHDDFFPGCRAAGNVVEIRLVEHQAGGFDLLVVAGDAVLVEQCALGSRRAGGPGWTCWVGAGNCHRRRRQRKAGTDRDTPTLYPLHAFETPLSSSK